jgi:hypothetical protein
VIDLLKVKQIVMIKALGGRKFIYALLVTILGFVLVLVEKVPASDYLTFVGVIGATYVLGNVANKAVTK